MSLKNKIAIGLIIVTALLFGIAINGLAYDINDKNLDDLAYQAATDSSWFISVPASDWANKTISAGNYKMGYYKSGLCMYHAQSNNGNAAYKITDVLDFDFDGNGIKVSRNGNPINTNEYTGTLAKALYTAYSSKEGTGYSESAWGSTEQKEDVIYAFSQAIQKNGIEVTSSFYTNIRSDDKGYFKNINIDNSYGTTAKNYKSVTKNSQDSAVTVQYQNGYTMIGPFNISYSGRNIQKVGVYSDLGSKEGSNGEDIYYTTWFTNVNEAVADISKLSNQIDTIPSGVNFYIIVSDQGKGFNNNNNLRVTFYQQPMKYYHAKLVLAQNPKAQGQNMGIFAAEEKELRGEQTYNITELNPMNFTVVKSGNNNVKQANVKFYLTKEAETKVYAKWETKEVGQNGEIIYNGVNFVTDYIDASNQELADKYVFKTGGNGKFIIKGLDTLYTYSLQEIDNPNPGYTDIDIKNATLTNGIASVKLSSTSSNNKNNLVTGIRLSSTQNNILEIIDRSTTDDFDIKINKVNKSGTELPGAEFKIRVKEGSKEIGWLYYDIKEKEWDYNNNYTKSTTWNTSEDDDSKYTVYAKNKGSIKLSNLSTEYEYEIYETKAATGYYNLNTQARSGSMKVTIDSKTTTMKENNYKKIDEDDNVWAVYCGTVSYTGDSSVTVKVVNVKSTGGGGGGGSSTQYLYISGNIWIDEKSNKKQEYDGLYSENTEDLYKQSVKVSLINSSGTTVRTETTTNGTYNLNTGISITSSTSNSSIASKLSGYYLKFEYSDKYTLVSPNFEKENGSKALSGIGEEDNEEVIEDGIGYIYNLSDYVDSFYSYKTLAHMNMGLIKGENPDYEITQNIAYVKVVINGHTYTYEYGGSGDTTKTAAPTVRWQNSYAYTRTIYPSDIAYGNNNENSLNVYVVYRIDVTNTNNTNTQYGKTKTTQYGYVSYVEIDLQVTSLTNEYDTNRYELETENDKNKNKDFGDWETSNGVATYKGNKFDKGIDAKDTETVYIQFKVKKEALNDLFSKEEIYEKQPTIATVYAYHDYWRTYRKARKNGGSYLVSRYKTTEKFEKTASAYYLRLMLNTERIITGTVFEDENVYLNGEVLGDGMFGNKADGSKENTIGNVKVDLISKDGNPAILYSSSNKYEAKQASTTSSSDGTYTFVGVTPGKYYVRFTYGDGNQKIFKPDGTEAGTVSINDYKSTIATDACIQAALGYELDGVKSSEEWYKHEKHSTNKANILYSTATDNLTQRAEYNQDNNSRTNIEASTALMSIGLENTQDNIATVTKTFEDDIIKEKILGINFGIIDIPEISLAFDKVVSNIKITNAQGNILAEGNPATKNIKYVNDLDKGAHLVEGSQHTKSEIKEQELYGSTLKLEYSITVQNNSEVNFYEPNSSKYYGYYYMFGDSTTSDSKEVTITVDNVLDFIDPSIKWENTSIDDKHKIAQVKASDNQVITDNIQTKTSLTYEYLVDITEWNKLYTTKNKDKNYSKDKTQDTAVLTAIKLLSTNTDDFGVSNVAQVTKLHVTDTPALIETIDASETYFNDAKYVNPTDEVYAIITPPTGEDRLTTLIYVIVEIIALSTITAGVVLIKKKVLDK